MIQLNDTRYPGQNVINLLLAVYTRQVPTFINTNLVLKKWPLRMPTSGYW